MSVSPLCDHVAAQLKPPLGHASPDVWTAQPAFEVIRNWLETIAVDGQPTSLDISERVIEPTDCVALRRHRVELSQPRVIDRTRRLDQLLGPRCGLELFDPKTEEGRVGGDGGCDIEIVVVGRPPKGGSQIRQLSCEPVVGLALPGAVPEREDVTFTTSEIAGVGITRLSCLASGDELLLGELTDRLPHRTPGPSRRPISHEKRLAHQGIQ